MARSVWKGPFFDNSKVFEDAKQNKNMSKLTKALKIWSRRSSTLPFFVGCYAQIYTGKVFVRSRITNSKVGHKFGEFASTRTNSRGFGKRIQAKTKR